MRASGILMPLFSLPSPYGIGSMGREAFDFVDFLKNSGQRYWQMLPVGPTGYGDSPYQSFCAFAGNPYFIDLRQLIADELLLEQEAASADFGSDPTRIDYEKLYENRFTVLRLAARRLSPQNARFAAFCTQNAAWLEEYALFMAIKGTQGMVSWQDWPEDLRLHKEPALREAAKELQDELHFRRAEQFWFYNQWEKLKAYANEQGIGIIGDLPIYVSPDSSDIWAHGELFQMNKDKTLSAVAGVPPDGFSADGQMWGNPLYDWDRHLATGCAWWVERLRHAGRVFDVVRIDHFRGFAGYYAVPAGDKTAVNGRWRKGPGLPFIRIVREELPTLSLIAEDLGFLTDEVRELLAQSGFPGMKVLQFAFDSREDSDYLPHTYTPNTVVYTGTHDNTTTCGWLNDAPLEDVAFAQQYLDITPERDFTYAMIRAALGSVSVTAIIPLQDWLRLGAEARINTPATLGGNWVWRMEPGALTKALAEEICTLTVIYGRANCQKSRRNDPPEQPKSNNGAGG